MTTQATEEQQLSSTVDVSTSKSQVTIGSRWLWTMVGLVTILGLYWPVFVLLFGTWTSNPDYSHGFFVPLFAGYLGWIRRKQLLADFERAQENSGLVIGLSLVFVGVFVRLAGIYTRTLSLESLSLLPFLVGICAIVWGRAAIRWVLPSALFLLFMIPLPSFLAGKMSGVLQTVATQVSTFGLQTLGVPAVADGNVISLSDGQIGVAEACSGLRMLYAFFALTIAACMIIDRSPLEKLFIAFSAIPIAIAANCIRILATGLAYEYLDAETAQHIFHDVAGWLMMPLGFIILLGGLAILDRLIVPAEPSAVGFR